MITRNQLERSSSVPSAVGAGNHSKPSGTHRRAKPGEMARSPRLKCLCWNVGGLGGDTYDSLLVYFRDAKVDVACIQETRWGYTREWEAHGYFCFHSGLKNNSTKSGEAGGVLICVRKGLASCSSLRWCSHVDGRLLQVRFPHGDKHVDIINVYQRYCPHGHANLDKIDAYHAFWQSLDKCLGSIPQRNMLTLAGDFNATISPRCPFIGPGVGPDSMHARPTDAELEAIFQTYSLCVLNTWCSARQYSCEGPGGGRSVIDFVAVRLQQADPRARCVQYMYDHVLLAGASSAHIPMETTIPTYWKCWRPVSSSSALLCHAPLDVEQFLADVSCGHPRYQEFLHGVSDALVRTQLSQVETVLREVANKFYSKNSVQSRSGIDRLTITRVRTWWSLWREMKGMHRQCLGNCFRCWYLLAQIWQLRRIQRRERVARKRRFLQAAVDQATLAASTGNQRLLHSTIRRLSPKVPRVRMQLRGDDGKLLSPSEEQELMRAHMSSQFVSMDAVLPDLRWCDALPFSSSDLLLSLRRTPARKAAPAGCCPSAFVKYSSELLAPYLIGCLHENWSGTYAVIPRLWCTSWICWLPKPGKSQAVMKGWRGISLQSIVGKAVMRTLTEKAKMHRSQTLKRFPQFAYISGRSTGEAILRVIGHISRAQAFGRQVHASHHELKEGKTRGILAGGFQFFMDVEGAFDNVSRMTLLNSLLLLGIPDDVISLILNWHADTPYIHSGNGYDVQVQANKGVRQGCVAAPILWTAFTHTIMIVLCSVLSEDWVRQHLTLFADDLHASWEFGSEEELEVALIQFKLLVTVLQIIGIVINVEKSVVMLHIRGTRAPKWKSKLLRRDHGKWKFRLPPHQPGDDVLFFSTAREHRYLGVVMSYMRSQDATLSYRMRMAQHTFIRLRMWWRSSLPIRDRMNLWMQVVWPTLTYGLSDVGLSKRGFSKFNGLVFRQWRVIGKSPLHITRESNEKLMQRLGVFDPMVQLGLLVLKMWQRRLATIDKSDSSDILACVHALCSTFAELNSFTHEWYVWCIDQWKEALRLLDDGHSVLTDWCSSLKDDLEAIQRRLCVRELRWQRPLDSSHAEMSGQKISTPPLPLPCCEPLTCPQCGRQFPHQMALRLHVRQAHGSSPARIGFDMRYDAHDGLPTCRHCGMRFRYWLGLRQHITNQVCENKRLGRSVHDTVLPVVAREGFMDRLRNGDWDSVLEDREFCTLASQHCVFCNQWFSRASSLGYHLQHSHSAWYSRGKQWFLHLVGARVLVRTTPCGWCGLVMKDCSLPKHYCPVVVQLGSLLAYCADPSDNVQSRPGSNRDSGDLRKIPSEQRGGASQQKAQECVLRRPCSRKWSCRGNKKEKEKEKEKGKKAKKVTNTMESLTLNLARMAIRMEDHANRQRLDTAFMLHFPTSAPILPALLEISKRWKHLQEEGVIRQEMPLRTVLLRCILEELIKSLSLLDESEENERVKTLKAASILDEEGLFCQQEWNAEKQELQLAKGRMSIAEARRNMQQLAPLLLEPEIVHRFHSARPLAQEYKGAHLAFFLEVGLRHPQADLAHQLLSALCNMSVMELVQCRLRKPGQKRSPLAQEIQQQLNALGRRGE